MDACQHFQQPFTITQQVPEASGPAEAALDDTVRTATPELCLMAGNVPFSRGMQCDWAAQHAVEGLAWSR